ncbi:efflux transporter outer membrane subunit [Novosphingobium sp. RL4]|uniref:efflux transporter outer membrane subunit n=1 Tax=Novosphingobium sp. RL4 TaxID=3109595 RepID=UPI002D7984EB|nr:efflux transporter outer membrane subunit [Novosphingobium sp. RL4]WRT94780.1 efflux transporter outer membrane subunit [Novosphingobium sp. RL4]
MRAAPLLLAVSLSILAGACTMGPDYDGPPAVASAAAARGGFVRADDPSLAAGPGLARWWESLGDPALTGLVDDALSNSPSIEAAQARIREARAKLEQSRAGLYPSVAANAMYVHATLPGSGIGGSSSSDGADGESSGSSALNFYNVGANVSWEPDLFGGKHRGVEAARATLDQRYADLADAQVSLSAQVAQSYVNLRDVQERARLNARSSELQRRAVELTRQRYAAGTASRLQVERLQNQLSATDAQNVPLTAQIAIYKDALAVLTGRAPGELDGALAAGAPVPLPPASVPIGDPAALIAHRPDVRSAERALAAGTAQIGVKKAQTLPGLKFSGILGLGGTEPGDVFDPGNFAALLMPQLSWPVLDFGKSGSAVREAEAQRDGAQAQYRQAVLEALQDAEDSLARFGATRRQLAQLTMAQRSAATAADLNRQRFRAGTSSLIDQLDIERQELSAATSTAQARAQLTIDYIAVQKALGLGWSDERR